jgi:regulatory protein
LAQPRQTALETALRALRSSDRSAAELEARLQQRGVGDAERAQALETLERIGYVDDERFARLRAERLAERGSGDALIRDDLERRGLAADVVERALGALEPERERARRIADDRGRTVKTARYLASKGFGEETLEGLVAVDE